MSFIKEKTWAEKKLINGIAYVKFFIIIFFCLISSVNIHHIFSYAAFPLFFFVPLYYYVETQKNLPLGVIIAGGLLHDFYLESPVIVYTFFFIMIYYSLKHYQRFILKSSSFKEWRFFIILCFFGFLIENIMISFIAHNMDFSGMIMRSFFGYGLLMVSYPVYKKPIEFIEKKWKI